MAIRKKLIWSATSTSLIPGSCQLSTPSGQVFMISFSYILGVDANNNNLCIKEIVADMNTCIFSVTCVQDY